jgi:hypothetical protein
MSLFVATWLAQRLKAETQLRPQLGAVQKDFLLLNDIQIYKTLCQKINVILFFNKMTFMYFLNYNFF